MLQYGRVNSVRHYFKVYAKGVEYGNRRVHLQRLVILAPVNVGRVNPGFPAHVDKRSPLPFGFGFYEGYKLGLVIEPWHGLSLPLCLPCAA